MKSKWFPRAVFAACLFPLAWLGVRYLRDDLGANPIETLLNELGFSGFVLLMATLACTPVHLLFKQAWPLRIRKILGDFCFFYICLHLTTWAALDQGLSFGDMAKDVAKHRFILLGMAAWLLLLPLAITSTQGWVKRLGFRRWKLLHRAVYLIGALACVHFLLRFKTPKPETLLWGAAFLGLMGVRVVEWVKRGRVT